jgi:hypothetical protein
MNAHRRDFLKAAGAAALISNGAPQAGAVPLTEKDKLSRIASNTWPVRYLFKSRSAGRRPNPDADAMKKKYGEITMLDFPQFTRNTFPGVTHMDLWSGVFGDVTDDSQYAQIPYTVNGATRTMREWDPAAPSSRKWLEQLAANIAKTGVKCHHISNNAPRDICDLDEAKRKEGIAVAKKWFDGAAVLGAKTMRVNTGGPRIAPPPLATADYPKNDEIVKYIANAVESFKEMADYGGNLGIKVTIENHWGLSANPTNVQIILDEVNHPFCEASPDFCNWEHEYLLYHGLQALAPYAHSTVHAKYWNRWKENDIQRSVRIMKNARFMGIFALEYEDGPWDGVEGARHIFKEVMAAL